MMNATQRDALRDGPAPSQEQERPSEGITDGSVATYERRTSIAVLCLELAHEIAPTLAFLRDLLRAEVLDGMDRSIAEEEVVRLQEVLASLRRTKRGEEHFASILLAPVAARAAARAHEDMGGALRVAVDVPDDVRVSSNERALELLLTALLRNALAAPNARDVRMIAHRGSPGWVLEIEDDGDGFSDGLEDRLFLPLATLGAGGSGTGMAVALRLARDHGWELEHDRRDGRTVVTLHLGGDT